MHPGRLRRFLKLLKVSKGHNQAIVLQNRLLLPIFYDTQTRSLIPCIIPIHIYNKNIFQFTQKHYIWHKLRVQKIIKKIVMLRQY